MAPSEDFGSGMKRSVRTDGGETGARSADDTDRCWDHEDCPRDDCDGELSQQDRFNVMCRSCEDVWIHVKNVEREDTLQTEDLETVVKKSGGDD